MKKVQLEQFTKYRFLSNLQCGSKKGQLAFVVTQANEDNGYDSHIFLYENENLRQLASGSNYIWDGENTLLLTSLREKEDRDAVAGGEERTVFYRVSADNGHIEKAFSVPLNVTKHVRLDSGKYLLQVKYNLRFSSMYLCSPDEKAEILAEKKEEQDYQVVDETPFYFDGMGWTNGLRYRLFLYDEAAGSLSALTKEETFTVSSFDVSPDKRKAVIIGNNFKSVKAGRPGIYLLNLKTGDMETLIEENKMMADTVKFYQGGLLIATTEAKVHGWNERPDFYTYNLANKTLHFLASNEYTLHTGIRTDSVFGPVHANRVKDDIFYTGVTKGYEGPIMQMSPDGSLEELVSVRGNVNDFDIQGNSLYYIAMIGDKLDELYCMNMSDRETRRLTSLNEEVLSDCYVARPRKLEFENDGVELDGWILYPKDYEAGGTYPAILDIHGGPCMTYGEIFYHEMQVWASEGYFVFFCNPRGSDGRGEAFSDIRGRMGTIDYSDIMKFTDVILERYPDIDKTRVGVTGGSYGGYMTNWIIGHTNRFKCAASQRSIANWISQNTYSDFSFPRGVDGVQGMPWGDIKKVWDQSPLQFADKCKTPTLFIHSTEDFRCPLPEGLSMYNAIAFCGTPARMCIFKGESHGLALKGKPQHRIRRLKEITDWMNKYLKASDTKE